MNHQDDDVMKSVERLSPTILVTPPTPNDALFNHGNASVISTNQHIFNKASSTLTLKGSKSSTLSLTVPSLCDAPSPNVTASTPGSPQSTPQATPTASMTSLFRLATRRPQHSRRLVFKDGTCNVTARHVTDRRWRYLADLFTTVIDLRWRWHAVMFATAFAVSWIGFAVVWWTIAAVNGDLVPSDGPGLDEREGERCVANVDDFQTALLFSIETQHTIGYGYRYTEVNCLAAIATMMLQAGVGVFIQCLITGIVFSKLSRPKSRAQTVLFSRHAVVCRRDGHYCLLFRVGDLQRSHIVGLSLRAVVVRNRLTREGESIPLCQYPIDIEKETSPPSTTMNAEDGGGHGGDSYLFLVWPVTVVHRIDERSPFWDMSAEQLLTERFEVIIILEGTVESNGKLTQVRTSYLSKEILWGHRLTPLDITYHKSNGLCDIDCAKFHSTTPVDDMPTCSARAFTVASKVAPPDGESDSIDHVVHVQSHELSVLDCDQQMDSSGSRSESQTRSRRGSSTSLTERPQANGKVFNVLPVRDRHQSSSDTNVDDENYNAMRI